MVTIARRWRAGSLLSLRAPFLYVPMALLCTLISSCWQPAFDAELADAALVARGMAIVAELRVEEMKSGSAERGLFLPRRVATPIDGVWLQGYGGMNETYKNITPYYFAAGKAGTLLSAQASPFTSAPDRPLVTMSPLATPTSSLEAAGLAGGEGTWTAGRIFEPPDAPRSLRLESNPSGSISDALLLGVGFRSVGQGLDELTVIYDDNASNTWRLAAFSYGSGLPSMTHTGPLEPTTDALAEPLSAPGFAARIDGVTYLSLRLKDGSAATYRWPDGPAATPERLSGISEPVTATLSDGTLLARDSSFVHAYKPDGTALYSLRLGSLRLAHERWDEEASAFVAVFVRQSFAPTSGEQGTLRLEVFEKPTKELPSLAEP